ncbi:MAG TPA: pyruvate, water dikinase regulatory protein [Thermoanaerobaculaceae bacterium]|nr:pyruvate, water dikinase regulatory protein [Thermoanaerobaculaceae bacterium]
MLKILVVSDATGETAERVVRSALTQFDDAPATVVRCGGVRTPEQVRSVVAEAAMRDSLIVHTLVSDNLRKVMLQEARIHGVDAMDLMGPALDRLAFHLGVSPHEKPGLFSQLTEAASRRIEAVEFAFRHDDGQHVEELERAEIVLVGVSRTMKTPTSLYLAYSGWFAANVPIVPAIEPAPPLLALAHERVFGLLMSPPRLAELRRARAAHLGIPPERYASLEAVREELAHSQALCQHHGWRRIDVTGKSVEEVAREIMVLGRHEPLPGSAAT